MSIFLCFTNHDFWGTFLLKFIFRYLLLYKNIDLRGLNMEGTIQLKRVDLYEQAWSIPMTKLAKQYQISDVGLAKICKKLKIPVPGRGYWAKKGKGKRPSLLSIKGIPEFVVHKITHDNPNLEKEENDEIHALISFEEKL